MNLSWHPWHTPRLPLEHCIYHRLSDLLLLGAALVRVAILERTRMNEPILLFCSIGVVYVFSMLGLLQNEPRQVNVLYVLGIPLVVDLFDRLSRRRAAPGASTPR